MPNADEANRAHHNAPSKKRKVVRACDECRSRKVRCDKPEQGSCANCIAAKIDCTFMSGSEKRSPPKGYVEALEDIIRGFAPEMDIEAEVTSRIQAQIAAGMRRASSTFPSVSRSSSTRRQAAQTIAGVMPPAAPSTELEIKVEYESSDDDVGASEIPKETGLEDDMERLSLALEMTNRFHGKSSSVMLVHAAYNLKSAAVGNTGEAPGSWFPNKWELDTWKDLPPPPTVNFPPQDLAHLLFGVYFNQVAPFLPVLNRRSFESQYEEGMHFRRSSFASLVLLVCAIASKFIDDPRIYLPGQGRMSAGWHWFAQVQGLQRSLHAPATISDLQGFVLQGYYLSSTSAPQSSWTIIGLGIRCAQDIGVHRRKLYRGLISREDEQWKRVWWCLVRQDRANSSSLGRTLACNDEDFDVDLPEEVDDEYWDNPIPPGSPSSARQPLGIPSNISFFNCALRIGRIQSFTLRTLYTINKSKMLHGFDGPEWEKKIVAELNSAMVRWHETIPDHLRWDPKRSDLIHFQQSAVLHAHYYFLYIEIYRPFTTAPHSKTGWTTLPSFSICVNAARSCLNILDTLQKRVDVLPAVPLVAAFTSGLIILMGMWAAKKMGVESDEAMDRADIKKSLVFLERAGFTWTPAVRLRDILLRLFPVDDTPPSPLKQDHVAFDSAPSGTSSEPPLHAYFGSSVFSDDQPTDFLEALQYMNAPYGVTVSDTPPISASGSLLDNGNTSRNLAPADSLFDGFMHSQIPVNSSFWDWPSTAPATVPNARSVHSYQSSGINGLRPDPTKFGSGFSTLDQDANTFWQHASEEWEKWSEVMISAEGQQFPLPQFPPT